MAGQKLTAQCDWLGEMERLCRLARYRDASLLYDAGVAAGDRPPNEAIFLRARALLRTDPKMVVPFLLKRDLHGPTPSEAARRNMYLGTGYS